MIPLHTRSFGAGSEEKIDQLTVFDALPWVVISATAGSGWAARGHERELKASGRHMKKHNAKLQIEYPRTATPEEVPKQTSIDRPL